jgi:biopolymer transport protein ExbD
MRVAEINVTPLIDVMLVLLILFMIVTPVADRSLDAAVPKPAREGAPGTPLVLTVHEDGRFSLNRKPLGGLVEAGERLRDALRAGASRLVLVEVSGDPNYARVVEALDLAKAAGAEHLGLR